MTLYWPAGPQPIELTQPRLHAFVIGVGDYRHLMNGTGAPANDNFGLAQLTTTVLTAKRIALWLATEYANPTCPLGSIELLLSPAEKFQGPGHSAVEIEEATMATIRRQFDLWFTRCDGHAGNVAFFYFAGHGISTVSQFLLPGDFGNPGSPKVWGNSIDFDGMRQGMRKNKADIQLFFADACREKPITALIQQAAAGDPLVDGAGPFDRVGSAAAYYAASDGRQAYGPKDDITFFAAALLESLAGAGATKKNGTWVVDTASLSNALPHIMDSLAVMHNQPLTCNPDPSGKPAAIHYPGRGAVRTTIRCTSPQANADLEITLARGATVHQSARGSARPWVATVDPGDWILDLAFTNFPKIQRSPWTLVPPTEDLVEPI